MTPEAAQTIYRLKKRKRRDEDENQGFLDSITSAATNLYGGARRAIGSASDLVASYGNPFEYNPESLIASDDYQRALRG